MSTWHIVHATGIVQAIYGGALKEFAEDKARAIESQTDAIVGVTTITGTKPTIGAEFRPPAPQEP